MPIKPLKAKLRRRPMTLAQEEHLIEGYALDSSFPFNSDEERKRLYLENKDYLFALCVDPRRGENHFFFTEDRKFPQAYFDYEDIEGMLKWQHRYGGMKKWVKMKLPGYGNQ
jgi:hypothetical protein